MKINVVKKDNDKLERLSRYIELMSSYWDVKRKLRNEFPDKFFESNRSFAQEMLDADLIKLKNEK